MSIESYIAARAAYVRANSSLDNLATQISTVGRYLSQNRERFSFSNTGQGLPMEAIMTRGAVSSDGGSWPSAHEIMAALAAWHEAKSNVRNTWGNLNADQRAALQPPPFETSR